jgi:hypothetical protein
MDVCILQWYANVPAWLNVKLKVWPGFRLPLLKAPVSLVTVCATESLLVQVTVVPVETFSDAGLKAYPEMLTAFPELPLLPLLHAAPTIAARTRTIVTIANFFAIFSQTSFSENSWYPASTRLNT